MISKIKKPVSILLVFMMIVSLFAVVPITASAAEETITLTSGRDRLSNYGITHIGDNSGSHLDFSGNELYHGTFVAPAGKVFTKIVTNGAGRGAMNWTGSADRVHHGNIEGQWYEYYNEDDEPIGYYLPFTISFTLADAITTYTVTWKNGDTTLKTDTVDKDAIPAYDGDTPVKDEDEQYTYTFSGWTDSSNTFYSKDSNLPAVTKDETYTATFASEDKAVKNVIALINALPAAAEITAADKAQIESARAAYDALTGDQKALVTNLDKLTAAETALAAAEKLFPQHSITLGGNIGVNFYINSKTADFAHAGSAVVKFTWDGGGEDRTKEVDLTKLTTDGDGYYKATVDVVAAQMAHEIHAEVYLNGEKLDQTDDYSVKEYAETVYANPEAYDTKGRPDELKALAKALLNYGAMAQTVFATSLNEQPELANTVVGENGYASVTAGDIAAAIKGSAFNVSEVEEALGAKFYTSSLIYLSKNTLRLYFTPTTYPGEIPNANAYTGNLSEYYYFIDHADIPAAELDNQQTFNVNGTEFTFSALDYAKAVVESTKMEPDQQNLAKALYLYNQKANAYFDAAPAPAEKILVLDDVTEDTTVEDGYTITGTLQGNFKISIADGATVTLRNANITNLGKNCDWAGINCPGNATLVLEGENTVCAGLDGSGYNNYPGIWIAPDKTLTIEGDGSLTAYSNNTNPFGAGIGGGYDIPAGNIVINGGIITANGGQYAAGIGSGESASCGNITITGGTITANGGENAAGIGSGYDTTCGNITINGGTVTAAGGEDAAGIGSGYDTTCGNITITDTVTLVTATKGGDESESIGAGTYGTCGTVTIGGVEGAITDSPYTYPAPAPVENVVDLSTLTGDYEAQNGDVLTGILSGEKQITIADGATVTLKNAEIAQDFSADSAGITLLGDATILLEGTNTVMGGYGDRPGIYVPANTTLTIDGDGSLTASGQDYGSGIGGGYGEAAGNIVINGGTITANGGEDAAGIGSGYMGSCGNITITDTVTLVTATKGGDESESIGKGTYGTCGTVTIAPGANVTQN